MTSSHISNIRQKEIKGMREELLITVCYLFRFKNTVSNWILWVNIFNVSNAYTVCTCVYSIYIFTSLVHSDSV